MAKMPDLVLKGAGKKQVVLNGFVTTDYNWSLPRTLFCS